MKDTEAQFSPLKGSFARRKELRAFPSRLKDEP